MSNTGVHVRNRHGGASAGLATTRDTHSAHGITPSISGMSYADARSGEQSQTLDIAPGAVDGTVHIVQGSISRELFAGSLMFPVVVGVLPVLPNTTYPLGSHVFLTTDKKLYRNDADVWVNDAAATNAFVAGVVTAAAIGVDELAANSIQTVHFQVGAFAPNVNNNPGAPASGEVIIDSTGITIKNGKIVMQDYSGLSVLTAAGFAGSWVEFIQHGVYNASFNAGADSSGQTAQTWDDGPLYEDTLSTVVPGWVIDSMGPNCSYGLFTNLTTGERSLRVVHVTDGAFREYVFYQDVPVVGGKVYEAYLNHDVIYGPHASHQGDVTLSLQWIDGSHAVIVGEPLVSSSDSFNSLGGEAGYVHFQTGAAPQKARYARLRLSASVNGTAATGTITVDYEDVTLRPAERRWSQEIGQWAVLGVDGYHGIRALSGSVPYQGMLVVEGGNGVLLRNINQGATAGPALVVSDGGIEFTAGYNTPDVKIIRTAADSLRIDANLQVYTGGTYSAITLGDSAAGGGLIDVGSGGVTDFMRLGVRTTTGTFASILALRNVGGDLRMGFYGAGTVTKPTVTGSRGGNAALTDLLAELALMGLITNSSTA